jgi:hypothetical protein
MDELRRIMTRKFVLLSMVMYVPCSDTLEMIGQSLEDTLPRGGGQQTGLASEDIAGIKGKLTSSIDIVSICKTGRRPTIATNTSTDTTEPVRTIQTRKILGDNYFC